MEARKIVVFVALNALASLTYLISLSLLEDVFDSLTFANFLYIFQLSGFVTPILLSGFGPLITRYFAKYSSIDDGVYVGDHIKFFLLLYIICVCLLFVFRVDSYLILGILIFILFRSIYAIGTAMLRIKGAVSNYSILVAGYMCCLLALPYFSSFLSAGAYMVLAMLLVFYKTLGKNEIILTTQRLSREFVQSKGLFMLHSFFGLLLIGADKLLIKDFLGSVDYVDYSLAYTSTSILVLGGSIINQNFTPKLFKWIQNRDILLVQNYLMYFSLLITVLALLIYVFWYNLSYIIFSSVSAFYFDTLPFLLIAGYLQVIYFALSTILIGIGEEKVLLKYLGILAVMNVLLLIISLKFGVYNFYLINPIVWGVMVLLLIRKIIVKYVKIN